jgi:hypothetical protein
MASLVLTGDTSGQVTIAAPAVSGTTTLTLQAVTGTMALQGDVLGIGQTWQSVTRTSGTTYTNSTGKPITVVSFALAGGSTTDAWTIAGVTFSTAVPGNATNISSTYIVPAGATYSHTTAGTVNVFELR